MKSEEQEEYWSVWSDIVVLRDSLLSSVVVVRAFAFFCARFVEKLFVEIREIENIKVEEITKLQREREREREREILNLKS